MMPLYLRPVSNVYLKKEKDVKIFSFLFASLLVLLPAILLLLLIIHWQNSLIKIGYELSLLEQNRARLENRRLELLAQKERLKSPQRLYEHALALEMKPPTPEQVIIIDEP